MDDDSRYNQWKDSIIIERDVIVVGGGISGLYSGALLKSTRPELTVAILESRSDAGGNIRDVGFSSETGFQRIPVLNPTPSIPPVVPAGPVRINPSQNMVIELANTLGVRCEHARYRDMAVVNGERRKSETVSPCEYAEAIRNPADFRFIGDFESTDPQRYMEFWQQDVFSYTNLFPGNGFSELAQKVARSFVQAGGRILVDTPATCISWDTRKNHYVVRTPDGDFSVSHCILAVPPLALRTIDGPIPEFLCSQAFVRETKAIPVTTVTMWFPTAWWISLGFQRIWDRLNPLLHIEFFNNKSMLESKAIRVSYADGSASGTYQRQARLPTCEPYAVSDMIRALKELLPEMASSIPDPLYVHVEHFENAWHFEYPGAQVDLSTKKRLAANLSELQKPELLGTGIYLVGEAYNPHRTWVEGALDSVKTALNPAFFNKKPPPLKPDLRKTCMLDRDWISMHVGDG